MNVHETFSFLYENWEDKHLNIKTKKKEKKKWRQFSALKANLQINLNWQFLQTCYNGPKKIKKLKKMIPLMRDFPF